MHILKVKLEGEVVLFLSESRRCLKIDNPYFVLSLANFINKQMEFDNKLNFDLSRLKTLHSKRDFENKQSYEELKIENNQFEDKKDLISI